MSDILQYVKIENNENIKKIRAKFPNIMFYCYDNGDFKFYLIFDGYSIRNKQVDLDVYYSNRLQEADLEDYTKLFTEASFLELRNKVSTLIFKASYTGKLVYSKLIKVLLGYD